MRTEVPDFVDVNEEVAPEHQRSTPRAGLRDAAILGLLTAGAVLIHGYHGGVEDAEIYLPGVLQHLDPTLFPRNAQFFNSHAGMTFFPALVSGSIRLSHLPPEVVLLLWHVATIFGLLWGCLRIARLCLPEKHAAWCGVGLVASLLTLPVAGTALYIMDQYVTSRSFSTAASVLALAAVLERRYFAAALWGLFAASVHPLMALFLLVLIGLLLLDAPARRMALAPAALPAVFFPPVTSAYRRVLESHPYFLLTNWAWDEWMGIFGPLVIMCALAMALRRAPGSAARLLRALVMFEALFLGCGLVISRPGPLERFSEIQPMRCLLLVYILMLLVGGCLLGQWALRRSVWRWALLFGPLCAGMAYAQVRLFPETRHLELPGEDSRNAWVEGFRWIRMHTPQDAYFALDPDYEQLPGEDIHGFRAIAQRSMLADNGKDSGAVSMFPALARQWSEQVDARRDWKHFERTDFLKLKARYGVDWVVLQEPGTRGLECPYQNKRIVVCRVD